ncbi:MAG TPA: histidine phosphatase family protein [Bacteroidota bacterium]|nr:histidine phosphatase family protein [Bacteroidota bacterium]
MFIYLLRHAVAVDRRDEQQPNDDRPLTKDGIEKMKKAAQGMKRLLADPIDVVLTSPLVRARDTARIAAEALGCEDRITVCTELAPGTPFETLREALTNYQRADKLMLVGHSPDLNFAASGFLGSASSIVEMKKGSVCCIEIASLAGRMEGRMHWLLQPKQLRQLA